MRKHYWLFIILVFSFVFRVWFTISTNYTAEDAHITYQFARNVARGAGFAAIPGVPIYGSTTPLFVFLLSGWLKISNDVVLGSKIIAILGTLGGLTLFYLAFVNKRIVLILMGFIALSPQIIFQDMSGMEMPLLFLFAAASYYGYTHNKYFLSGVMCGLLLWTRVDGVIWVGSLFIVILLQSWKNALRFLAGTAIYLPWIVFAWVYFGSPIPFTIIAKQVAYGIGNPPYGVHLSRIISYLGLPIFVLAIGTILLVRKKLLSVFSIFVLAETFRLIITGATFFDRYFYLLAIVSFVLGSIGIAKITRKNRVPSILIVLMLMVFSFSKLNPVLAHASRLQQRHRTLKNIGVWLNLNSPLNSTVLLEPLGYVGWYADRIMFDEVGLVTPKAVALKRLGVPGYSYYNYFQTDYVIWPCGAGGEHRERINNTYTLTKVFDGGMLRACYEIWRK